MGKLPETGCEEEDIKEHFAQVFLDALASLERVMFVAVFFS